MIDTVEITTQAQPNEQVIEQKKEAAPSSLWRRLAMPLGGFSGGDPILTTTQLAALVKNGTVRFFLLKGSGGFGGGPGGSSQSALVIWIKQHSMAVPSSQWRSSSPSSSSSGFGGFGGTSQLYEYTSAA